VDVGDLAHGMGARGLVAGDAVCEEESLGVLLVDGLGELEDVPVLLGEGAEGGGEFLYIVSLEVILNMVRV